MKEKHVKIFKCGCKFPKRKRLVFDGGSSGKYCLELCVYCGNKEDRKFLVSEEQI